MTGNELKLEEGQEVTINIPFTYTIGEVGHYSNKILETVDDCKAEVIAEIDSGSLNTTDIFLSL